MSVNEFSPRNPDHSASGPTPGHRQRGESAAVQYSSTMGQTYSHLPNGVRKVGDILTGLGAMGTITHLPQGAPTAAAAAEALDVTVAQIANSLIFEADGSPLLVIISGSHRADTHKLASLTDGSKVSRADAAFVRLNTGQPIGGVSPVGHPRPIHTLIDVTLARYPEVWASAGHPDYVFNTTYDELLRITAGYAAEVGEAPA